MLKYNTTRLEKHVRKTFLSICWLEDSKTARVSETSIKPTAYKNVCQHVYLIVLKFEFRFLLQCLASVTFRLDNHDPHHSSNCVRYLISTDYETFKNPMNALNALISQVFVLAFGLGGRNRVI